MILIHAYASSVFWNSGVGDGTGGKGKAKGVKHMDADPQSNRSKKRRRYHRAPVQR